MLKKIILIVFLILSTSNCSNIIGEPFEAKDEENALDGTGGSSSDVESNETEDHTECSVDADCQIYAEICEISICVNNICRKEFKPFSFTKNEVIGDCLQVGCTGANSFETYIWDDKDIIDDENPCTINYCLAGKPRIELIDKKCRP